MSQTRYERLKTNSNEDDEHQQQPRRNSSLTDHHDEANEEIELFTDKRLSYHITKAPEYTQKEVLESRYANGGLEPANDSSSNNNTNDQHEPPVTLEVPGARFMQMAIGTLATILLYLTLSICLTFYQKELIKKLKFPLTIVTYHLIIKLMLATCVRSIYKCRMGKSRVQLDWRVAVRKMAPTGIASGIDIGFSNWGLELVPISLYTMTKSSTIVFILFFAILLGLEKKSWSLVFIVGLIATGLFMFTYKSTQFDALGFGFILIASLSSGVRWSFAQFVMQKTKLGLHNPVDMIYHMQPWMIASLLPFLVTFEGQNLYDVLRDLADYPSVDIADVFLKISFGAILAFLMEVSEFLVLSKTSSLTLSIAGIFKDICQLALAVEFNNDELSLMNVFGLTVCLAGICFHLLHKYSVLTKQTALNESDSFEDDFESSSYHETASIGGGAQHQNNATLAATRPSLKKHSTLTMPLLEQSDSDNSNNEGDDAQNASDVIFDVLKRRDMQR